MMVLLVPSMTSLKLMLLSLQNSPLLSPCRQSSEGTLTGKADRTNQEHYARHVLNIIVIARQIGFAKGISAVGP